MLAWGSSKAPAESMTVVSGFASAVAGVHASGGAIVALMTNGHVAIAQAPAFVAKVRAHDARLAPTILTHTHIHTVHYETNVLNLRI